MRRASDENGYTMLEAIMYISIMIVLSGVLAKYVGTVFTRYKTGRVSQQVVDLKKIIVFFTAADEDYSKLTLEELTEKKALPFDMANQHNALGGKIEISSVQAMRKEAGLSTTSDDNYMFHISFDGLPRESCIELLTQGQFYGGGTDIDTIIVNNSYAWQYQYSLYDTVGLSHVQPKISLPESSIKINITKALEACTEEENNKISWIFS
ncbi:MAG: hypothetical protein NC218_06390 [Acetobacter sp.]|nr:hypothetical protein [Acetobacter sp.]